MYIETLEVAGIGSAIKGMRNPMNSWNKSDTVNNIIGKNDLELGKKLVLAGAEHAKFTRQIKVWADFDMPRYFWSEMDTYKFNNKNSCSTMHRLLHKTTEITKDLFIYDEKDSDIIESIIARLNEIRLEYLETKSVDLIRRAKQLLPEGFLQLRTVDTNYAELRNIFKQRRHHKLKKEWQEIFCNWVRSLPYSKELILVGLEG